MNNRSGDSKEGVEQPFHSQLCANNCGFFANPALQGYCSKCYNDKFRKDGADHTPEDVSNQLATETPSRSPHPQINMTPSSCATATTIPAAPASEVPSATPALVDVPAVSKPEIQVDSNAAKPQDSVSTSAAPVARPNRCFAKNCSKKVALMGFKCKCGHMFCSAHRLPEQHNCEFDFKKLERQRIADSNPVISAGKVDKI